MKNYIGLIGLAVMGQNLALNIARNGFSVSVYNRTPERTKEFIEKRVKEEKIDPYYDLKSFVESLEKPRKIILMVKAGQPVDEMIQELLPYLEPGDLIIDGGNSYFRDTSRRIRELKDKGILYLGMGVSGGEYGALHGPSLMPGGTKEAYKLVEEMLLKIAAKTEDGPCCTYVGDDSAGHFVKMVHNGIEYAIMELIAEIYDIMRKVLNMPSEEIGKVFESWNNGELNSFLMEISYKIMRVKDEETGKPLVELILDKAEQKGTGKWTAQTALDLGIPTPTLNMAVEARIISHFKDLRVELSKTLPVSKESISLNREEILKDLEKALLFGVFISFSQGLWLIDEASKVLNYNIDLSEVLRIWKGGCIIRAKILNFLREIIKENPQNANLLASEKTVNFLKDKIESVKKISDIGKRSGISLLCLNSALDYYFALATENLPANLIQAQRDFFGAHTYERIDKEGIFHTEWEKLE
ncbi:MULTISPECIES: NADP-dependent phosphogluconate dehydrogenase [Dictyoglomus]|uniref:6-phosphogluconate dehydrogenase, decarboxylating n=1 Tax=Dictyoglomus turgidum (strain DSM 6724 / Z-1310) TaxID=515635 RepID=B8E1K1_DICTD|nr:MULTISPECIES: NADP-dependent phosphogluconate dehydrogenase [Dictyoglomus]ACK41526.1 6-phosphogluconate dehydrogenase, decarboxylating [Dictyoglomus turgidum DSM 6724]HBU31917.1 phosphogluconate dehydrogenase (NADP(+)-dependent, decarboxylating) [Dictyoglomus sp.]